MGQAWSLEGVDNGCCRVLVSGELDLAIEEALVELVTTRLDDDGVVRVQLDLGAVDFIDSSGVRALLRLHLDHPHAVELVAVPPPVRRVLTVAGLDVLL